MRILSVVAVKGDYLSTQDRNSAFWRRIYSIKNGLELSGHSVDLVFYPWSYSVSALMVPLRHLEKVLKGNYDLVYGNDHGGTFFSLLGTLTSTPLIFDMHGGSYEELMQARHDRGLHFILTYIRNKIPDTLNVHGSKKIICVSKRMIKYLEEKKGVNPKKLFYLPMGVDLDYFKEVNNLQTRQLREHLGKKFVLGYIGSFLKFQGVANFIEAAKQLSDKNIAFLIVGSPNTFTDGNIHFVGKVPYSKIVEYYSVCDAFILPRPSHIATEIASPTKFSEYCAIGKPVLTSNVGDAADLVRRYDCGLVVKDNSPENLKRGIVELSSKSKNELSIMGHNAQLLASNEFDWNKIINNLLYQIQSCL